MSSPNQPRRAIHFTASSTGTTEKASATISTQSAEREAERPERSLEKRDVDDRDQQQQLPGDGQVQPPVRERAPERPRADRIGSCRP